MDERLEFGIKCLSRAVWSGDDGIRSAVRHRRVGNQIRRPGHNTANDNKQREGVENLVGLGLCGLHSGLTTDNLPGIVH